MLLFRCAVTDVQRSMYRARFEDLRLSRQPSKVQEARILLVLSRPASSAASAFWTVSGCGISPTGEFVISGEYNPITGRCVATSTHPLDTFLQSAALVLGCDSPCLQAEIMKLGSCFCCTGATATLAYAHSHYHGVGEIVAPLALPLLRVSVCCENVRDLQSLDSVQIPSL